jgi:hypothetical protein
LSEAEENGFEPVVVEQGPAQDALVGRVRFLHQIEAYRVIAHAD